MQTELNLGLPKLTYEQKYWLKIKAMKGNVITTHNERARLILTEFIKIDKIKKNERP